MKKGFMDPRKPIVGTVTRLPFLLALLLIILVAGVCTMIFSGRMSSREQELEARLHDKARAVELQEQRLKRFKSDLRDELNARGDKQNAETDEAEAAAIEAEAAAAH